MRIFRPSDERPHDALLVEAVDGGDAAAVRERLAAGASPDSCDPTDTPVLALAAIQGRRDIFEMLLNAGADPYLGHAGLAAPWALSCAASTGQWEIVEVWVRRGLDVNLADGVGNTPLMAACAAGHVEVVRRLLAAGADVHARTVDGITAYSVARHGRHRDVVTVLREVGATFDPTDPLLAELAAVEAAGAAFASGADLPSFREVLRHVAGALGREARRWERHEGVYAFDPDSVEPARWHAQCEHVCRQGFHLIRSRPNWSDSGGTLLLFPTSDKDAVISACGTDGGSCDLSTGKIIAWLRKLDRKRPFLLTGCGEDFLAGRFSNPVKHARRLALSMYRFCPDVVDQGCRTVDRLAEELQRTQEFAFWWD